MEPRPCGSWPGTHCSKTTGRIWQPPTSSLTGPGLAPGKLTTSTSEAIAGQFQCEGIWWDTICIPMEAIQKTQDNYQDPVPRLLPPELGLGPPNSMLTLVRSRLDHARAGQLAQGYRQPDGPRKGAARLIKLLRNGFQMKDPNSLNNLQTVLGSRHTSWPKDMAIITAFTGVFWLD